MLIRLLKKDLKRKKTMNIILLAFIITATMFLAGSVSNLRIIGNAIPSFMDKANVPDLLVIMNDEDSMVSKLEDLLATSTNYTSVDHSDSHMLLQSNFYYLNNGKEEKMSNISYISVQNQNSPYQLVFDENDQPFQLKDNEIALPSVIKIDNKLKIGDEILIKLGSYERTYKIAAFTKDAMLNTKMVGVHRFFLSDQDYAELSKQSGAQPTKFYYVMSDHVSDFLHEFQENNISYFITLQRSQAPLVYLMELMVAAILIIVSLCLIGISFLILRFTIVFTMQEDYQQIGVMKAIGIKNRKIKQLYLVKYLALALAGASIGLGLSFPLCNFLTKLALTSMTISNASSQAGISILCSIVIVLLVILFCYLSTSKVNHFSAMEAIRNGSTCERFTKKSKISLHKHNHMKPSVYLSVNDIFGHFKRYIILFLTFCLGTFLTILPVNAANTLRDEKLISLFGLEQTDLYYIPDNLNDIVMAHDRNILSEDLKQTSEEFKRLGYDIDLHAELALIGYYSSTSHEDALSIMSFQSFHNSDPSYPLLEGNVPILENEIAITYVIADKLGVGIGDTVTAVFGEDKYQFVVSGIYQSMNNMGENTRLSEAVSINYKNLSAITTYQGNFKSLNPKETANAIKELKKHYPNAIVQTPKEMANSWLSTIVYQINNAGKIILALVLIINCGLTVLMMKSFITKDKGSIAMLKSIGYKNGTIRIWQTLRIVFILILSIVVGCILTFATNNLTLGTIFCTMGAKKIYITIKPLEVLVFYPLLLLGTTSFVAFLSTRSVKKVGISDMNVLE
ncbi:MAG: FtsX-like permease family protein [Clostridiales bacterium]|nr:FtsX-like permease family protein [Clostridiales bacterium]